MSLPFIGEIQIFGFGYAPPGWALCDGRLVAVNAYPDLFALIGTTYGGDGVKKFRLPNLVGRAVCGHGSGSGLTPRQLGEHFGVNRVSLTAAPAPPERHTVNLVALRAGGVSQPDYALAAAEPAPAPALSYYSQPGNQQAETAAMATTVRAIVGRAQHDNRQPFLALSFYIALRGAMPLF